MCRNRLADYCKPLFWYHLGASQPIVVSLVILSCIMAVSSRAPPNLPLQLSLGKCSAVIIIIVVVSSPEYEKIRDLPIRVQKGGQLCVVGVVVVLLLLVLLLCVARFSSNTITNGTTAAAAYSHGHAHAHDDDDDLDLDLDVDVLSDGLVAAYVGVVMESKVEVVYIYIHIYICV